MIKVIRIISRLNIGGPAVHTILLTSSFNKAGLYKDILICGQPGESEGDMSYLAAQKDVKPVLIPEMARELSFVMDIKAFSKLYSIIRKEKPDIVHTHAAKAGALGRLAAVLNGVPIRIHTFHGHVFDSYFSPMKARFFLYVEKFLGLFTDKVIVVSDTVKNDIVNRLKVTRENKCVVIPLGLDLDKFSKAETPPGFFRKKFSLGQDTLLVGIVGRLVPIKNHAMFLEVARKVKEEAPGLKVRFVVIGDGELRGSLEQQAAGLGLTDFVYFTGWTNKLPEVYRDLDIVALTSLNEGTPVSLIEAMASKKPVIATNAGGVKDLIRDGYNGILVERNDIGGFCKKLVDLIGDVEKRESLGMNAKRSVVEKYSCDRLVKDMDTLYRELVAKI